MRPLVAPIHYLPDQVPAYSKISSDSIVVKLSKYVLSHRLRPLLDYIGTAPLQSWSRIRPLKFLLPEYVEAPIYIRP